MEKKPASDDRLRERLRTALRGMQFGQLTIVIKDGTVVQIERTEKFRLPKVEGQFGDGI